MKTFALALRNLLRNRRRSLTTLMAIILGCNAILLFGGFSRNINYGLQTSIVQRVGHIQIQHKDYFVFGTGNPGAYGIDDYQQVADVVRRDPVLAPMLSVVTPTLQLGGIAGNFSAGVSRTVLGSGFVVEEQNRMRQWNDYHFPMLPPPLGLTGTPSDSAVIGLGVARVLQLCGPLKIDSCPKPASAAANRAGAASAPDAPEDIANLNQLALQERPEKALPQTSVELLASNPHGAPNVALLNVVEASNQGVKEIDDMYVGLHLEQAQRLVYGRERPKVTSIQLQLKHTSQIPQANARLRELLATTFKDRPLDIHEFFTLNPQYGQTIGMFAAIFGFVAILIGAIVLFMVGNTMSMAVVERTVEIGTLRAIGMRRGGIRRLFVAEGVLIGVIGAVTGVLAALLMAALVNSSGLTWIPPGQVNPIPLSIRVWGEVPMIVGCSVGVLLVAMLSSLWPAGQASKMNIVDALRHV